MTVSLTVPGDRADADDLVLLTWCAPWLVAVPVSAVRRIVETPTAADGVQHDLASVLGLPAGGTGGSWLLIDCRPGLALRVDRCLQLVRSGTLRQVPPAMQRRDLDLAAFAPPATIAGLTQVPPVGLWLDPRQVPAEFRR